MRRIALGIEYQGTNYSGWQKQQDPAVPSVQAELETALGKIANHAVLTVCAGRTDAGVHASAQVVHADVSVERSERAWVFGCNTHLPRDIRVLWAKDVALDFDARRSAIQRHYKYVIYNSSLRPGLLNNYVSWHFIPLDVAKMQEAANNWLGTHDFSSFRAAGCQSKSPVRDLHEFTIRRSGNLVIFDILANAFLYHMIRNMVGTLLAIGGSKRPINYAQEVLLARDRSKASITAPPEGLYLAGVKYPQQLQIPVPSSGLWFINQG
jgi:tRNA pseudouridine38-40 synthase